MFSFPNCPDHPEHRLQPLDTSKPPRGRWFCIVDHKVYEWKKYRSPHRSPSGRITYIESYRHTGEEAV